MIAPMTDRQRRAITDDSPRPAKALRDETRLYIVFEPKTMVTQQKAMQFLIVVVAIWGVTVAIVSAARIIPPKDWFDWVQLVLGGIGLPVTLLVMGICYASLNVPESNLPLFFIDAEKGYAGDLDDCFAIQEIESIGVARVDGTAFGTKCIAVTLREGKTYLFAAVDSDWFKVREAAAQAEEIRRGFVAPTTPLPKPTAMGFEMPAMA